MKKARFLALTSLCSVLAGMPAKALEIKDSGAKKIEGVETQVDKESPNGTNKNEPKNKFDVEYINKMLKDPGFIKYAKWSLAIGEVTHELLSYFKGNPGQFYEKPAKFSITGQVRKLQKLKKKVEPENGLKDDATLVLNKVFGADENEAKAELERQIALKNREELKPIFEKIKKLAPDILLDNRIYAKANSNVCKELGTRISVVEMVIDQKLEGLKAVLKNAGITEEEFQKISNCANFYICYFRFIGSVGLMLAFCSKDSNLIVYESNGVDNKEGFLDFQKKFALLTKGL